MHQFGSMVLAADAYRRELLADAARVRSIPTSDDAKNPVPTAFAQSRRALGTMLVRAGQHLQAAHPIGQVRRGSGTANEPGRTF
ncbi:MAG: hypothetical protein M3Q03_12590 [Chloroflexota bacterium]|nr:hypothetical protein [Chloroflexota bacterium]